MAFNLTDADAVVKDYYTDDVIKEQSFYENPFLGMCPKDDAEGRRTPQPIDIAHPGGASAGYGEAMTNPTKSRYEDFMLTVKDQYQRVVVDHKALLSTRTKKGAFKKAFDEFDRGFRGLGEKIAKRMYRTSGGTVGSCVAVTSATVELTDPADAFNFEIGDRLNLYSAITGGTARGSGGVLTVTNVGREAGTVTLSAAPNTLSGATAGDFLVRVGDYDLCLAGLEDWLPVTDRATRLAASFFGCTRSVDPDRLGGIYLDGSGLGGLDEILIKLVGKVGKHGGNPSHIFLNPETMTDLQILLQGRSMICQDITTRVRGEDGLMTIGFPGLKVQVGGKTVRIYGDRNCPSNRIYALQMDTWKLWHVGPTFGYQGQEFGLPMLKMAETEDSLESRICSYLQIGCSAPGWNGVASIPVAA